jgi:hypothetical protein
VLARRGFSIESVEQAIDLSPIEDQCRALMQGTQLRPPLQPADCIARPSGQAQRERLKVLEALDSRTIV